MHKIQLLDNKKIVYFHLLNTRELNVNNERRILNQIFKPNHLLPILLILVSISVVNSVKNS